MQVGAVNPVNFKGYESYELSDDECRISDSFDCDCPDCTKEEADTFVRNTNKVNANDIKNPVAIILAIGTAALAAFKVASSLAGRASKLKFKDKTVAEYFDKFAKNCNKFMKEKAENIKVVEGEKFAKTKNFAKEAMEFARNNLKKAYQFKNEGTAQEMGEKAIKRIAGTGAVLAGVPNILNNDHNEDGVADIIQKSQNAYIDIENKCNDTDKQISQIAKFAAEILA